MVIKMNKKISFIGLGKLGLPLACCLAEAGREILCVDKNELVLDKLSKGELPFYEPGLEDLLSKANKNILGYTDSYAQAIKETDTSIILVNTQLGNDGYAADFVEQALSDIAINLRNSDKEYHLIILSSTVLPGTIKKKLIPLVEKISGKNYKEGFGFSYVPDFVKLGTVISDFKNPEFFMIGSNYEKDTKITKEVFSNLHQNVSPSYVITLEEAEVSKVALNAFVVNKITFANFLGRLCDGYENVDVNKVTAVIGNDKRISPHFFKSGAPYGGTCFPRDAWAFIKFAKDRGKQADNLIFAEKVNQMVHEEILQKVKSYKKIGVLGISFKPNSPVTIGSPSVKVLEELISNGKEVHAYDFLSESLGDLEEEVCICQSAQECVDKTEVTILMHFDSRFSKLDFGEKDKVDVWGILK
tara:strand:- start:1423 stop:2667 length:1245 start_codon:yes stop_codon:yes gene_type:complete